MKDREKEFERMNTKIIEQTRIIDHLCSASKNMS